MPRRVEAQEQQNAIERQLLQGTGMSQADIEAATPQPGMRWLSPAQGGFTGKVLGGVGDVGSVLSTIVGKPIPSPRASLAELAESTKMRTAFSKEQARRRFIDVVKDPKSTSQDIAAAGAEAGSLDEAMRFLRPTAPRPPGSAFAARQRLATLDPNSDEAKQLRQGLADDEAARQRVADEAARRAEERFRKEHPFADVPPEEMQRRRAEEIQRERNAEADRKNLKPGSPEREFFLEHGYQPAPPRPQKEKGASMQGLAMEVTRELQRENPALPIDQDELRRRVYDRAKAYTSQGITVEGFDPSIAPPQPPPKAGAAGGAQVGAALGGTPVPGPTTDPMSGLPPEVHAVLDNAPLTSPEQADQVRQLVAASKVGTPTDTLVNWAMSIARMGQPQQPAAPR